MEQKLKEKAKEAKILSAKLMEEGNQIESTYHLIRANTFLEAAVIIMEEKLNDSHKQNNISVYDSTKDIH